MPTPGKHPFFSAFFSPCGCGSPYIMKVTPELLIDLFTEAPTDLSGLCIPQQKQDCCSSLMNNK